MSLRVSSMSGAFEVAVDEKVAVDETVQYPSSGRFLGNALGLDDFLEGESLDGSSSNC